MRNWCATVVLGVLFALPLCAQQKDASTGTKPSGSTESSATANAAASDFSIAPASSSLFAMPAAAAPKPDIFSDWENNPWNRHAWGLLTPKFEVAGMFQYVNFCPCNSNNFNNYGASGSFTYNANKWLGLTAEVSGYHFDRTVFGPPVDNGDGTVSFRKIRLPVAGRRICLALGSISATSITSCHLPKSCSARRTPGHS